MAVPSTNPAAAHHVQHGVLFGHPQRGIVQVQAVSQDHQFRPGGPPGQGCRHEVWGRHQAVSVLVVLIDSDAVEPQLLGVLQLVQVRVIELVSLGWVVEAVGQVYPDAVVLPLEVVRQERVRHQVEGYELHGAVLGTSGGGAGQPAGSTSALGR